MYGVVEIAGHQYCVKAGDIIDVEKISKDINTSVEFDKVLFIGGENALVGLPTVAGAKINAKVIRQARDKKVLVLKRRPGRYVKCRGHRQSYTGLLITEIHDGKGNVAKVDAENKRAQKFLK